MLDLSLRTRWLSLASSLLAVTACASDPADHVGPAPDDPMMEEQPPAPVVLPHIDGVVVDRAGLPLANKIVVVAGKSVLSDAEGKFTFTDVTAPYEVVLTETGSSLVSSVVGLTTATPRILYTYWPESHDATIQGALMTPTKQGDHMMLGVTTPYSAETFDNMYAPNFNNQYARWWGPETTTASILAIKYTDDGTPKANPVSFEALGTATVQVEAGKVTSGIALAAHDPIEVMMAGTIAVPADTEWASVTMFAAAGGASVEVHRFDGTGALAAFSGVMPSGVGISAGFTASAHTPDGEAMRFVRDIPTDAQDLVLTVPAPAHIEEPALGTAVTPGDAIRWSDVNHKLFIVDIAQYDATQNRYPWNWRTLTSGHSVTIPDLASLGMHWVPGRPVTMWIYAYDLPMTLDEAAGYSLDTVLDKVWGSDGMTSIDGSLAFTRDGVGFTSN
ncbi:MAG: hypothetical protein SFX73_07880 [Kofleriaceae bacterium]|nr:hypothetical protein [Kofleriaceae bacterium]